MQSVLIHFNTFRYLTDSVFGYSLQGQSDSESESESLYDWRFITNQFALAPSPLRLTGRIFFSRMNTYGHNPYIITSLTRGWICHLQLLLALTSAFILGSRSRGTRDHILMSQNRDFPPCRLLRLPGLRWRYSTPPPHGNSPLSKLVKVNLRLAVYRPSVCLGVKPFETHDQRYFPPTETLRY
jgi:hypothetical protein